MLAALQATMSRSSRSTLVFIDNRSDRPLQLLHCDTGAGRCVKAASCLSRRGRSSSVHASAFDSHRDSITSRFDWHSVWADRPPPTIAPNEQVVFGCQSDGVFSSAEAHAQVSRNGVLLRRRAHQVPATAPQ
jgi:hypothetical protein